MAIYTTGWDVTFFGRTAVKFGQCANVVEVSLLGAGRQVSEVHVLNHAESQRRHIEAPFVLVLFRKNGLHEGDLCTC